MLKFGILLLLVMTAGISGHSFNIFMTGDSHVCSKVYPERVGDILVDADPEIDFSYWGKIGASIETFNDTHELMQHVYDSRPDILIVHLGTNDSYAKTFHREWFTDNLSTFYSNVKDKFPSCLMVFVTPFYNRLKDHTLNTNTRLCADACLDFADTHADFFVVDNNADYGMHFLDGGSRLIRSDNVHLTHEGYEELGDQVGQGIIDIEELWLIGEEPYFD